ncbi:Hypothetical predicted protein, partial [Pelobates cultripes]
PKKHHLQKALDAQSIKLNNSWQISVETKCKGLHELGARTVYTESKMVEFATAHNNQADRVPYLEKQLAIMENKMMNAEDRARRNKLRLREVPETEMQDDLPAYFQSLINSLIPEIPLDMLLLD